MFVYRASLSRWLLAVAFFGGVATARDSLFDICRDRISSIRNGTSTFNGITNETIEQYIHFGPVRGLPTELRDNLTVITTAGCKVLCGDPVDWYWASDINLTLGIVSNWIIPILALLAALPYDSLHRRNDGARWYQGRVMRTTGALLNWIGSPQTALTATLFNIHQIRKCFHATEASGEGISGDMKLQPLKRDAYYVLCCIGQFKLQNVDEKFLRVLTYGLFRPICDVTVGEGGKAGTSSADKTTQTNAEIWTAELLQSMAFQLRMLRRRGVYPAFVSVFLFFIAYAISIALAFADVGERTTTHSLAFGILISWLPLLVLFALLDRNPVSADRSKKLISRWLWNVNAVMEWADNPRDNDPEWWQQSPEVTTNNQTPVSQQSLSSKSQEYPTGTDKIAHSQSHASLSRFDHYISDFAGQGRQIGYNGLAYAVLVSVYDTSHDDRQIQKLDTIVAQALSRLEGPRPGSWWVLSVISLAIVWLEIGMAFMTSYNVPTIGIGCRSMSYLIYGGLSSIPWMIQFLPWFRQPGTKRKALCHGFCVLSTFCLLFITFAAFSGVLKNCACRGGLSGYIDFESSQYYRKYFNVAKWWRGSAAVGALPLFGSFLAAVLLLMRLKSLWHTSEQSNPLGRNANIDMKWLV